MVRRTGVEPVQELPRWNLNAGNPEKMAVSGPEVSVEVRESSSTFARVGGSPPGTVHASPADEALKAAIKAALDEGLYERARALIVLLQGS